jgi:hypothetical protein
MRLKAERSDNIKLTGASASCGASALRVSRTARPCLSLSSESWITTRSDDELLDDPGARTCVEIKFRAPHAIDAIT